MGGVIVCDGGDLICNDDAAEENCDPDPDPDPEPDTEPDTDPDTDTDSDDKQCSCSAAPSIPGLFGLGLLLLPLIRRRRV